MARISERVAAESSSGLLNPVRGRHGSTPVPPALRQSPPGASTASHSRRRRPGARARRRGSVLLQSLSRGAEQQAVTQPRGAAGFHRRQRDARECCHAGSLSPRVIEQVRQEAVRGGLLFHVGALFGGIRASAPRQCQGIHRSGPSANATSPSSQVAGLRGCDSPPCATLRAPLPLFRKRPPVSGCGPALPARSWAARTANRLPAASSCARAAVSFGIAALNRILARELRRLGVGRMGFG